MSTGCGHFQGTLGIFLAAYIRKVEVARRLLSRVDEVASPRLMVTPPWVWLGRRATTPEGQLLALEVSWVGGSERSRVGLPAFTPEDLEQVRALRQAGSQESWTTSLAVAHQLGMLGELKRSPDRVRLLVEVSAWALDPARPVWPAIEVLASGASALRKPELDGLWGPELAARLEAFLARPEVLRDESGEIQRSNFGDLVAARRERDPGFEFRSAFE